MRIRTFAVAVLASVIAVAAGPAAAQYTPEQVISTLHESIRLLMGNKLPEDGVQPDNKWLSLTIVGAVAEADDPPAVYDLANFCPEVSPVLSSFGSVRKLDAIYSKVLEGLTGPFRPFTDDYFAALKVLRTDDGKPTAEYAAYQSFLTQFTEAFTAYLIETDEAKKPLLRARARQIETNWRVLGFKTEVEAALLTISSEQATYGTEKQFERNTILTAYRDTALDGVDNLGRAFRAPVSELSPPVNAWANETGWVSVSFSDVDVDKLYSATTSQTRGFGGLSLGFVSVAVAGGGNKENEHSVNTVKSLKYTYELKRVQIRRPWLDGVVFFEPLGWTWVKRQNTPQYPRVSAGKDEKGTPVAPTSITYDNSDIGCPMIPLEMVIARKRTIEATVSRSDYQKITTSGSSSGGGSAFGIFGGGKKKSWTTVTVTESGDDVTFRIESPSIAVIGLISEVLPVLPAPNPNDTWPEEAWLEEN